ncbi:MAG: glycosyltransferase family 2 protein [Candidatus Saccharicenans sp.]
MKFSAVLVTYNSEKIIIDCLESLRGVADEIVVVDSESTDQTRKIARYFTDKVIRHHSTDYVELKNLGHQLATNEWVLSVEPDERLSAGLRLELLEWKKNPEEADGFTIPRKSFYLERWIRHSGWYPNRRVRFYRKSRACWKREAGRVLVEVEGEIKKFKSDLEHIAFSSISEHLHYIDRMSENRARKLYAGKKKARFYHLCWSPFWAFLKSYFFKLGCLDGFPGLVISVMSGYSVFLKYAKLKEIWKKGEKIEPVPCGQ